MTMEFIEAVLREEGEPAIAKAYFKKHKENVIVIAREEKNDKVYIWREELGIWRKSKMEDLSAHIVDFLQKECKKLVKKNKKDFTALKNIATVATKFSKKSVAQSIASQFIYKLKNYQEKTHRNCEFDSATDVWNFRNGILNLRTGEFRVRVQADMISKYLDYDYTPEYEGSIAKEILDTFWKIFNNDWDQVESQLLWTAYCLTGEISEQCWMIYSGRSAANGKSTICNMINKVFPIYTMMCQSRTFEKGGNRLAKVKGSLEKPVRYCYIEELGKKSKQDVEEIKALCGGDIDANSKLFEHQTNTAIQYKFNICTNHGIIFGDDEQTDQGILRRFKLQICNNRFLVGEKYKKAINKKYADGRKIYVGDKDLRKKYASYDYQIALVNILLAYTKRYYKYGFYGMDYMTQQFEEEMTEENSFDEIFETYIEMTGKDTDKVLKNTLHDFLREKISGGFKMSDKILTDTLAANSVVFKKNIRFGKDRGGYAGIRIRTEDEVNTKETSESETEVKEIIPFVGRLLKSLDEE